MFKLIKMEDIPLSTYSGKNSRVNDIEKFLATGADACEILLWQNESPTSVAASFKNAVSRRERYEKSVYVLMRAGRVFLVRHPEKRVKHAE